MMDLIIGIIGLLSLIGILLMKSREREIDKRNPFVDITNNEMKKKD